MASGVTFDFHLAARLSPFPNTLLEGSPSLLEQMIVRFVVDP